jgi:PAS domain S-box-containing protein
LRPSTRRSRESALEPPIPPDPAVQLGSVASPAPALRDHFAAIVEYTDDAILSKDREGVIQSWNPAAERMYGYTAVEAIGRPISILIPESRQGDESRILAEILKGNRIEHYETERVTKDGRLITVSLSVSPIRDESGEIISASVIARDVTERRRSIEMSARLQALTAALASEITPERVIETLLEQTVAALGADAATLGLLDRQTNEIVLSGSRGHTESGLADWSRFATDAPLPMSDTLRTGEAIWTHTAAELVQRYPALREAEVVYDSLAVVPLAAGGAPFGALALSFTAAREFSPHERAFLGAAAQQAAQILERARLYEAQRIASERLSFLAEAGEALSSSLDLDWSLRQLADLAVRRVADWCGIELLDEDGQLRNVAVAHADPARVELARHLRTRYPIDPGAETGVANVVRSGDPELYPEVSDEMLAGAARDAEHLRLMRELGLSSVMIVPLAARGSTLGAITFVAAESGRRFDGADLDLASDLARRAGMAIDNSLLYRREHEAAVTLQRSLLPKSLPVIAGMQFASRYDPAAPGLEVGGDWYEVVERDDGSVVAMIGDVAGRGIRAAAVMGRLRSTLRAFVADGHGPREAVERLDRQMKEVDEPEMATAFQIHYDPRSGAASYVRAGHPPALLRLPDGRVEELGGGGTPPLGILEPFTAQAHAVAIPAGSLVLLYTDGLIERRGTDLEVELDRLKRRLAAAPAGPEQCLERLAEEFSAEAIPDDVAMLAFATAP